MDKTVPAAAAHILKQIYVLEARGDYETISSFKQHLLRTPITKLTLGELLTEMKQWRSRYGTLSSAAGAPQIIEKTLRGLIKDLKLNLNQKYDPNLQDRLAYHLLRVRGYDAWIDGRITNNEFAKRLAMEWASLPVLRNGTKGAHRTLKRGMSYYQGDMLNGTKYPAASFEKLLADAKGLQGRIDIPAPKSTAGKVTGGAVVGGAVTGVVVDQHEAILSSLGSATEFATTAVGYITAGATAIAQIGSVVPDWFLYPVLIAGGGYLVYRFWSKRKGK